MGLFSSKYVTTVGTSISRLVDETDVVDPAVLAIQTALFKKEDVVDHILESTLDNFAYKVERAYRYGATNYIYGLPSGEIYSSSYGLSEARDVLTGIEGQQVTIDYCNYGPFNSIHAGWVKLIADYGYNTGTNELTVLSAQKGSSVYLKDMALEIPRGLETTYAKESLAVWGRPANSGYLPTRPWELSPDLAFFYFGPTLPVFTDVAEERLKVTYVWVTESWTEGQFYGDSYEPPQYTRTVHEEVLYLPIPAHDPDANYFHVKYYAGTAIKYATYRDGSGTYPTLDAVFTNAPNVMADFYPNIYFRLAKTNPANDPNSAHFQSSKKIAKRLGLDYADLVGKIHENPDIGDVEQALLTLAVPAESNDPQDLRYLFDFFSKLHLNGGSSGSGDFLQNYLRTYFFGGSLNLEEYMKSVVIQDGAFKMSLRYLHTTKARKVGQLGAIGTCTVERGTYDIAKEAYTYFGETQQLSTVSETIPYFTYRKQVALNFYEEVTVVGLRMRYHIFDKYDNTMGDDNEDDIEDREIILVPLDRSITREYTPGEEHRLYTRSMHFVFNSRVVTKVRWYQRGVWKSLIKIVGIVATIYFLGSDGGFFASLSASLAAGAYATAITLIVTQIVEYIVISTLFKLFVKAVGLEGAFIAAVIAAAYGVYNQLSSGLRTLTATAKDFLTLANGLVDAAQSVLKGMYKDLLNDWDEFKTEVEEATKLLEEKSELLYTDITKVPLVMFGETPDQYFGRTVHSGNIGMLLIEDTHSFVDRSLTLPSVSTTLGGFNHVS